MTQKVSVILVDDMSGEEADETVEFGLDGTGYEIDLSLQNSQEPRNLLKPYIETGLFQGNYMPTHDYIE